jgi:hypothetical protein
MTNTHGSDRQSGVGRQTNKDSHRERAAAAPALEAAHGRNGSAVDARVEPRRAHVREGAAQKLVHALSRAGHAVRLLGRAEGGGAVDHPARGHLRDAAVHGKVVAVYVDDVRLCAHHRLMQRRKEKRGEGKKGGG